MSSAQTQPLDLHDPTLRAAWDGFVTAHPHGTFAQLTGHLAALAAATHYRVEGRLLRRDESLVGVLAWIRHRGRRISLPFYEYGGPLLTPEATAEEVALLLGPGPLELRMAHGWHGADPGLGRQRLYPFAVLELTADPEAVLAGCDRQVRKAIRKAEREGVEVTADHSKDALERDFWPAYLCWMRDRHGTPPLSRRYWEAVQAALPGAWKLFAARHQGRLLAQLLGFAVGQRVVITTIISDEQDWSLRPNDLVHWALVRWACETGYRYFDFGGARYEGQRRYKEKWGCRLVDYELLTWPASAATQPPAPEGAAAQLARGLWRRLPLAWTARLGPPLREWLTL